MNDVTVVMPAGLDEAVQKFPAVQAASMVAAERIASVARSTAPVGDPAEDPHAGDYKAGIDVQAFNGGARVRASDQKSAWIEFGVPSRNIRPRFILRSAVIAAGFKFRKSRA